MYKAGGDLRAVHLADCTLRGAKKQDEGAYFKHLKHFECPKTHPLVMTN